MKVDQVFIDELSEVPLNFFDRAEGRYSTGTGYTPLPPALVLEQLKYLLNSGEVCLGASFIDLGSGPGNVVVAAAHAGFDSYGVERDQRLFMFSEELIERARDSGRLNGSRCSVFNGSYYPAEYIRRRMQGETVAVKYEGAPDDLRFFFPEPMPRDIREDIGVGLEDIDIFYCYTWASQTPSIIELFGLYAKGSAILLLIPADVVDGAADLLSELNLESRYWDMSEGRFVNPREQTIVGNEFNLLRKNKTLQRNKLISLTS